MTQVKVWDPLVRLFHWSLVALFAANALVVDDDSKLHEWVGYGVMALVVLRILWGFVGTRHARFADFPPSVSGAVEQMSDMATQRVRIHKGHTPLGALMIYNLLAALLMIGLSGYLMTTVTFWGMEWVEEFHEAAVTWTEFSVVMHIAAVIWESRRSGVNLPKAMVTGVKTIPAQQSGRVV